jgi:hypothetical protein
MLRKNPLKSINQSISQSNLNTYQSASLVVMQVHECARKASGVPGIILFLLSGINETFGEAIAVVRIIATSAPDPITTEI